MKNKMLAQETNRIPAKTAARSAVMQFNAPHSLECEIQHALTEDTDVCVNSLVVHRTKNGVCLKGVLEFDGECPDITKRIQALTGIEEVINHLLIKRRMPLPKKG
ncbi:hypothetical protein [Gimesia sp.]|uniref:hypothetical protein n=1 Tax=Gimesia sp. TaxID=2024833 RepID=UPI003A94376B